MYMEKEKKQDARSLQSKLKTGVSAQVAASAAPQQSSILASKAKAAGGVAGAAAGGAGLGSTMQPKKMTMDPSQASAMTQGTTRMSMPA